MLSKNSGRHYNDKREERGGGNKQRKREEMESRSDVGEEREKEGRFERS